MWTKWKHYILTIAFIIFFFLQKWRRGVHFDGISEVTELKKRCFFFF